MVDSTQLAGMSDPTKEFMPSLSFSSDPDPTHKTINSSGLPAGLSGDLDIFGLSGDPGGSSSTPVFNSSGQPSGADTSSSSGGFDLGSLLSSIPGLGNLFQGSSAGLTGLGPYLGVAAYGLDQAKKTQKDNQARVDQLAGLGQPYLDASKQLLQQYQSGTLRPEQQKLVDLATQEGEGLIQSGSTLSAIAQQAFQDYNAGKLPQADEDRLAQQVNAQKQQVRQVLAQRGITDSSVLTSQDQAIDAQAAQTRQQLLDSRFATGNQAYNSWLNSTQAGNQLKLQGQQFASQAFEQMMSDSLGLGQEGMAPVMQSIALAVQSDNELAQTMTDLLTNLASAYAYQVASNTKTGGGAAGGTGTNLFGGQAGGSNILGQILGTAGNVVGGVGKVLGDVVGGIGDIFGADTGTGGFGDILGDIGGIFKGKGSTGTVGTGGIFGTNPSSAGGAGSAAGLGPAGTALGTLGAGYGLYNAVDKWQSGDTGGDALRGAQAGAAIGSIVPGLGTVLGGLIGGGLGAVSSAFGGGKVAQETKEWKSWLDAYEKDPSVAAQTKNPFAIMTGIFDEKQSTLGSLPMYEQYGRRGQNQFTTDLTKQVNDAYKSGKITNADTVDTVYDKIIDPWINSMGGGWAGVADKEKAYVEPAKAVMKQMITQYVAGQYSNWLNRSGDYTIGNQITPLGK